MTASEDIARVRCQIEAALNAPSPTDGRALLRGVIKPLSDAFAAARELEHRHKALEARVKASRTTH